jgi:hypothetical protein
MASQAASCREDVKQLQRRFVEFRETHAARSRLPRSCGRGGEAGAARRDRQARGAQHAARLLPLHLVAFFQRPGNCSAAVVLQKLRRGTKIQCG